jgi:hypothetical protein
MWRILYSLQIGLKSTETFTSERLMNRFWHPRCLFLAVLLPLAAAGARADEPGWIALSGKDLSAWKPRTGDWLITDSVALDATNPRRLAAQPGEGGILVNGKNGRAPNLLSKQNFADVEVHAEFLVAKRSNSGIKLEGLYEIQIFDSFGVKEPTGSDSGGIYPRAEGQPTYHHIDKGFPPRVNAAKPAGEWQALDLSFQAPRFDQTGKKTANARFVRVVLNGQMIHENVEVPYPTGAAWHDKEVATGPLLLQGDHGPVAFRNVRARPLAGGESKNKP